MRPHYVVTFMFSDDWNYILLMKKLKPAYLAGKWNGPGGRVEESDPTIIHAALREIKEETGIDLYGQSVYAQHIIHMMFAESADAMKEGNFHYVDFLCMNTDLIYKRKQMEKEELRIFSVKQLLSRRQKDVQLVSNLYWMLPFALDNHRTALLHCEEIGVEPTK